MAETFRSYETARKLFSLLEFICWCVVGVGALIVLLGFSQAPSTTRQFGMQPSFMMVYGTSVIGIFVALNGIIGAATVQFFRAGVDTAEYSQQQLSIARKQLEVSRQALGQSPAKSSGFEFAPSAKPEKHDVKSGNTKAPKKEPSISAPTRQHEIVALNPAQSRLSYRDVKFSKRTDGSYIMEGRTYATLDDITLRIDHQLK